MSIAIYILNIDQKLQNLVSENPMFVYGGITEQHLETRRQQHVYKKQPKQCDNTWIIEKVTTIKITNKYSLEYYKKLISDVETYIINKLFETFNNKCTNDKNKNGMMAQRGGAGENINIGDVVQVYIYYKPRQHINFM